MRDSNRRPPGWHINPKDSKQWRYWDGGGWTNHYEPRDPQFPDLAPIRLPSLSPRPRHPPEPRASRQKNRKQQNHDILTPHVPQKQQKKPNRKTAPPTTKAAPSETPLITKAASSTVVPKTTTPSVPSETTKQPGWHADPQDDARRRSKSAAAVAPQPGWHAGPQDDNQWRYWNGTEWVESRPPQQSHGTERETLPDSSQSAAIKKTLNGENRRIDAANNPDRLLEAIKKTLNGENRREFAQWWKSLKPGERIIVASCAFMTLIVFLLLWT